MGAGANAYTLALRAGGRRPFYVVEIETTKRCALTFGQAPCPAVGSTPCYGSWATCPTAATRAAFTGSTYTWRYSSCEIPLHEMAALMTSYAPATSSQYGILPLVSKVDFADSKIDAEAGFSRRGKANVSFHDVGTLNANLTQALPTPGFDPDKSVRNTGRAGFWWLRWLAQWPNYRNMVMRIKRGFFGSSFAATDLETCWEGLVEDIARETNGTIKLVATDVLEPLTKEIPRQAGNLNTLATDVSRSATAWTVQDVRRFSDPASLVSGYVHVEAETTTGRKEIVRVSAVNESTDVMTVVRAQAGTYAEPIRAGTTVREVLAFGIGDGITEGRPLAIIKAILERVGLPAATYVDGTSFAHAEDLIGPVAVRRVVREPKAANSLVNELCELFQICLFVGKTNKIEARVNFPSRPGETIGTVTDARNVMVGTGTTKTGDRQRITHVNVYYDHDDDGEGSWPQDGGIAVFINAAATAPMFYGDALQDVQAKSIDGRWIRGDDTDLADWVASAWGTTLGDAPMRFSWSAELRDATMGLGDLVDITSVDILDEHGSRKTTRAMIVERKPADLGGFTFVAQTFGFFPTSQGGKRIALVAPAGQADYDSASDAEKLFAYVGTSATDDDGDTATDTATVGAAADDGWYL